jgi:hypothetical protein
MKMRSPLFSLCLILSLLLPGLAFAQSAEKPLTKAEASGFTATSRQADVMDFIRDLQRLSPRVRVEILGVSTEGRPIPMLIIGDPVPASPQDLNYSDKLVIYFQANIHAGEVEGKEASLMLARDLALGEASRFLDKLVVLIVPDFNPDGNERISPDNRSDQAGPEQGVGVRANGQNLDLNRDGMKLESPEVRGLVQNVMQRWDPAVLLDSHTHNGSYHEEVVTYVWSLNPNGDRSLISYMSDVFSPGVDKILKDKHNTLCIPHGDFMSTEEPEKGWAPLGPEPRYISNYIGLRNRLGILNENYPYAPFKDRVMGAYRLFLSISEYGQAHAADIRSLIREADRRTVSRGMRPTEQDTFGVEFDVRPIGRKITVHGYEMETYTAENGRPGTRKTDRTQTYTMPFYSDYFATRTVRLPYAYLIPRPIPEVKALLERHGVCVETLVEPTRLSVESFFVTKLEGQAQPYQGHRLNRVKGEYKQAEVEFPAGTLVVTLAQPLANVASSLLEPESDDGLVVWNFFDRYLVQQWSQAPQVYPVYKLFTPALLVKDTDRGDR